jgi:4-amino-4-deoxy-L-arabinose transferase-like glycosyltransferase
VGRLLGLPAILLLSAGLRLWRLGQNGFGNEYYAAGVLSMSTSWRNFLYVAFDPAGFVSVDKPPVALWLQVASVKLFGFHGLSVLVPQVLEGLAAVWLVYHLVRHGFGTAAGLLAGLFLAVTPVSVAVDRSSNTESCLVLALLLAAWALLRAAETGSRPLLVLSAAVVGVAFNVKMLAAFVVVPTFVLVYALGAPAGWRRRILDLTVAGVVVLVVSLSWAAVYDLTPRASRPYAGTTDRNSVFELMVGPYGVGRFVRQPRPAALVATTDGATADAVAARGQSPARPPVREAAWRPRTGVARLFVGAPAGPLRLADGQLAGQVAWLLPFALAGLVLGAGLEPRRLPLAPAHLALLLWGGWAFTYAVVYSAAGGFFHYFYLSTMAPALAALASIGVITLWRGAGRPGWRAFLAPAVLVATAIWQFHIEASALGDRGWLQTWLHAALFGGVLFAAGWLTVIPLRPAWQPFARGLAAGGLGVGLAALLVVPTAWTLSTVLLPGNGFMPSADLYRLLAPDPRLDTRARSWMGDPGNLARLVAFLHSSRRGERYLLATSTAILAAPIIIQTGEPVMARGGFHGLDPILTPEKLAALVAAREVRFVMLGDLSAVSRRLGAEQAGRPIAEWVRANGRPVDPALWRADGRRADGLSLYDLRPDAGLDRPGS